MKILILIMFTLLIGCDIDNNNHGYGYNYDYITPQGIEYRYDNGSRLEFYDIDNKYLAVSECMGINHYPSDLMIIMTNDINRFNPPVGTAGAFVSEPNLILLKEQIYTRWVSNTLAHEFIHYLLQIKTGSKDINHNSHYFIDCA